MVCSEAAHMREGARLPKAGWRLPWEACHRPLSRTLMLQANPSAPGPPRFVGLPVIPGEKAMAGLSPIAERQDASADVETMPKSGTSSNPRLGKFLGQLAQRRRL
jgi:hypothetical protein